jgi:hypothetical protein
MSEITLTLPDDVFHQAELWARTTGRPVKDILAEAVERSLRQLGSPPGGGTPPESWPDEEVLAAADAMLSPGDDERLSELLDRQQAGQLIEAERAELAALMQVYSTGLLHKAFALREAVRRGLREPLQP